MSVIQSEFLRVYRQSVQRSYLLFAHLTSVRDEVLERDPTMCSDHAMFEPAGLYFLDDKWT